MTNVSKGINEPEVLIRAVIDGKAPQYTYQGGKTTESNVSDETAGRQIYKHLMNGVSYMLPFVIGGGIMIACRISHRYDRGSTKGFYLWDLYYSSSLL